MPGEARNSGIALLGAVPWSTHICHFYTSPRDILDIVVPFIAAGLRQNERCMWISSEPLPKKSVLEFIAQEPGDLGSSLRSGKLAVLSYDEWYVAKETNKENARVDPSTICEKWLTAAKDALNSGFDGLRITGSAGWVQENDLAVLMEYEEMLSHSLHQVPILALCSYPFKHRSFNDIRHVIEITNLHDYALLKYEGRWETLTCGKRYGREIESLFNSISDSILIVNARGQVLAANKMCLRNIGVSSVVDLPKNLKDFLKVLNLKPLAKFQEEIPMLVEDPAMVEITSMISGVRTCAVPAVPDTPDFLKHLEQRLWQLRLPSGNVKYFLVRVAPVIEDWADVQHRGDELHAEDRYILVFQDVTHLKELENVREEVLRMTAHDLGNPVQVIKSVVSIMKTKTFQEKSMGRYISILEKQLSDISTMLENMLIATVNGKTVSLELVTVNLSDTLSELLESYALDLDHEVIPLFSNRERVMIVVDPAKLRQVLSNLISNACKYTPAGKKIWIDFEVLDGDVLIKVEDEGIGIPPEETQKVFKRFYRGSNVRGNAASGSGEASGMRSSANARVEAGADAHVEEGASIFGKANVSLSDAPKSGGTKRSSPKGMGLGLYASKYIVHMLGGELWAEPRPGGGTIMNLKLPLGVEKR